MIKFSSSFSIRDLDEFLEELLETSAEDPTEEDFPWVVDGEETPNSERDPKRPGEPPPKRQSTPDGPQQDPSRPL